MVYPRVLSPCVRRSGRQTPLWIGLALLALSASSAWCQSAEPALPEKPMLQPSHSLGDQMLQITVGPMIPLFFQSLSGSIAATGLTVGGAGSLQWNAYVTKDIRIGIEVGGLFALSPRDNTLLMVPITFKGTYVFSRYPFEFPISLGIGGEVLKYVDDVYVAPIVKPAVGAFYQFDVTWSFGINLAYWWVPLISSAADTRFGNFLEIGLSAIYHY